MTIPATQNAGVRASASRWFAGATLTVVGNAAIYAFLAVAIVPYWQELSGDELQDWFAGPFARFSNLMVPLHLLAIITSIGAAWTNRRIRTGRRLGVVALVGLLASQAFNFTIFAMSLNPDLSSGDLNDTEARETLDLWDQLHLVRTTLVVVAAFALIALVAVRSDRTRNRPA